MKYNAIIIGAGAIAGGYDSIDDNSILTHAHAYKKHPLINFLGFYDVDMAKAKYMAQKWNTNAFESLNAIPSVDIVSICTPDKYHLDSVQEVLSLNPKFIFLEKPAGVNFEEIKILVAISQKIPIQVNYSRRFIPQFQQLAKRIDKGEFGKFIAGHGFYGKGYIHNGSHMRDLLELFLGSIISVQELSAQNDFYEHDLTKDMRLCFDNGAFYMQGVDCNIVTMFEFDLIFEKWRIRILDGGQNVEEYCVDNDPLYDNYKIFSCVSSFTIQATCALKNAVDNMIDHLETGVKLLSPMRYFI